MITIETRYHVFIVELVIENLKSQVVELVRWPRILIKISNLSGDQHFFQNSPGIKSHYDRVENFSIYLPGRDILGARRQFQETYWQGKPSGHISPGHLDRVSLGLLLMCKQIFLFEKVFKFIKFNSQCQSLRDRYLLLSLRNKQWTNVVTVWSYHVTYAFQRESTWRNWRNAYLTR